MEKHVDWSHDAAVVDRIWEKLDSCGRYMGRPLLLMDTPIDGSVFVGKYAREAITVDSTGPDVQILYQQTKDRLADKKFNALYASETYSSAEEYRTARTLWAVNRVVMGAFSPQRTDRRRKQKPFNPERAVDDLVAELAAGSDKPVPLDVFIKSRAGACRHEAPAAGILLERLIRDSYLAGKVSVDRNTIDYMSHAWARYTTPTEQVWIVDPTQMLICDKLERVASIEGAWKYQRPSDILVIPMQNA